MHRINKLEVELRVDDVVLARELSDRVSRIHGNRIAPAIDQACSQAAPLDETRCIERLELDVGVLSSESFEDELVEKLAAALESALASTVHDTPRADHPVRAALELIETFALSGALPWWADPRDGGVVARSFARASRDAEAEVLALVRRIGVDDGALERLARTCDHQALMAIARRNGFDETSSRRTDLQARRSAIAVLAAGPGPSPRFDATTTAKYEVDTRDSSVAAAARSAQQIVDASPSVDGASQQIADRHAPPIVDGASQRIVDGERDVAQADFAGISTPDIDSADRGADVVARSRATNTDAERVVTPTESQATQRDRPDPGSLASFVPAASTAASSGAGDRMTVAQDRRLIDPPPAHLRQADPHGVVRQRRRAALAKLDEVYIDNAGLVLLWPFLERFFTRVGLLDDKRRFPTAHAASQGVALLQLLAEPDSELLEFQLPLAKVLCGCSVESDVTLDDLPSLDQRAEGEHLLAAVIDHVKPLGGTSTDGFRRAFLQRRGALTTRDGAWLLQVERQPHDVVLDRFSWSWSWVKLAWMPDALQVEW